MNWFKRSSHSIKIASVTIAPADSGKVYQPMNLIDLFYKLLGYIEVEIRRASNSDAAMTNKDLMIGATADMDATYIDFESADGKDAHQFDNYVGKFSFGTYEPIDPDEIAKIIDQWVDHMESVDDFDIVWGRQAGGRSKISEKWIRSKGVNPSTRTNWTIVINKNPSINAPEIPSLNVANANWHVLLNLLMPENNGEGAESYAGRMNVDDLERRLNIAEGIFESNHDNYTQEYSDSHNLEIPEDATPEERKRIISEQHKNRKSMRVLDFGLPKERILSYFNELRNIIQYCRKHGVGTISWG